MFASGRPSGRDQGGKGARGGERREPRGHSQLSAEQVGRGRGLRGRRVPGAPAAGSAGRGEAVTRAARSRRGARSSRARAASAASARRGRRAAGRGAMGECAARGAPRGSAAGGKRVSAGRPGIALLPATACGLFSGSQAAGAGWHSEVGAGGGPRSRGRRRAWASRGAQSSRLGGCPHVRPRSPLRRGAGSGDFAQLHSHRFACGQAPGQGEEGHFPASASTGCLRCAKGCKLRLKADLPRGATPSRSQGAGVRARRSAQVSRPTAPRPRFRFGVSGRHLGVSGWGGGTRCGTGAGGGSVPGEELGAARGGRRAGTTHPAGAVQGAAGTAAFRAD